MTKISQLTTLAAVVGAVVEEISPHVSQDERRKLVTVTEAILTQYGGTAREFYPGFGAELGNKLMDVFAGLSVVIQDPESERLVASHTAAQQLVTELSGAVF